MRLRHLPSGLIVIAEESRSQHENRDKALKRLRRAFYLHWRDPLPEGGRSAGYWSQHPDWAAVLKPNGRLEVGRKDPKFWPAAGVILDLLDAVQARISEVATILEISTGNLIDFLETDPKLWQETNQLRQKYGHKPLRDSS